MLGLGGKSRVKGTLHPLSGSIHPAIISAQISRFNIRGIVRVGLLSIPPHNLPSKRKGRKFSGLKGSRFANKQTLITYIFQLRKSIFGCQSCHI